MNLARKIEALMVSLTEEHLKELSPAERKRLSDRCLFVSLLADRQERASMHPSGVLYELKAYRRES